jgi:Protein of unknown function (DUF1759)
VGGFCEKFKLLVGNNSSLLMTQKLQNLQYVLDNDALEQSDVCQMFESLWEALTLRNENERFIVDHHISKLLNLRNLQQESANDLRN